MLFSPSRSTFITHSKSKLESEYTTQSKLGEGAFGSVFLSTHKTSSEPRAVKHIAKSGIKFPERLKTEVSTLISCDHPNIIKIFEIFEDRKNLYIVMEQCPGGELFDYILNKTKLEEAEAAKLFRQIMLAVNYLHSKNIVHRDLKPENLMFSDDRTLKLIDFGIAKVLREGEEMTTRAGTPFYISPEILTGNYGISTDIWSAGVILYIMLCGDPPFYSESDAEIFKKILIGNFSFRGAKWRKVSSGAKDLIKSMLTVNTKLRITAAEALNHPWLAVKEPLIPLPISSTQLESFTLSTRLRKAILLCIASHCTDSQIHKIREAFLALDSESKGSIKISDLTESLAKCLQLTSNNSSLLSSSIDINANGSIEYSEFIASNLPVEIYTSQSSLLYTFSVFDRNHNGKISADDLQQLFSRPNKKTLPQFAELITENGCLSAGGLSFEEFSNILISNKSSDSL